MRVLRKLLLLVLFAAILSAGCSRESASSSQPSSTRALRLVSLAPHLTELAFAAGAGKQLVGVVAYSDYPAAARDITRVGDAFNLDFERMAELAPDLVLAWHGGTPTTVIERLQKMGLKVVPVRTVTLEDVAKSLITIGELAGDASLARSRAEAYQAALRQERRDFSEDEQVRVFYQVSLEPLYTPGGPHFISELISLCGGQNIFGDLDLQAAAVSHEAVLSRDPQLIVVGEQWLTETRELWGRFSAMSPPVEGINADLVTRPGLRLAQGAAALCVVIDAARTGPRTQSRN